MNNQLYQQYLNEFVNEAISNSNGSNSDIYAWLAEKQIKGMFVRHKEEKLRALADARRAFDEHRHWPTDIVLSHLGVDVKLHP